MSSAITLAGQTRINQLRGEEKPLVIDRMVLALVPGLDPTQPVDRNQQMPASAHIVHTYQIPPEFKGYVDPDQVVYSMILGSDVGNFSFNWIGTVEAVTGKVITVTTTPSTPKRKTDLASNTTGNNITRNVMMQFQDAQALTGVSISAETWQFDYRAEFDGHLGDKGNPHGVTKAQVGLGNLPNAKSDSVASQNSSVLATSKAVKMAYDKGGEAQAVANSKSTVRVLTGECANGAHLPIPEGYNEEQCVFVYVVYAVQTDGDDWTNVYFTRQVNVPLGGSSLISIKYIVMGVK